MATDDGIVPGAQQAENQCEGVSQCTWKQFAFGVRVYGLIVGDVAMLRC